MPLHRARGVTPDASVSVRLYFTVAVKSVQGAGLGSGLGEVAGEKAWRGVRGHALMQDAGRPRATV